MTKEEIIHEMREIAHLNKAVEHLVISLNQRTEHLIENLWVLVPEIKKEK